MTAAGLALPIVNEVPKEFPALLLWQFRIASLGAQLIMRATIGLVFGSLGERWLGFEQQRRIRADASRRAPLALKSVHRCGRIV